MADARIAYGLAKKEGINTEGMSPKEVWEALNKKGITPESAEKSMRDNEAQKRNELEKKYNDDLPNNTKTIKSSEQIKNKNDFVNYIEFQTGVKLDNNPDEMFNNKRNLLYTTVPDKEKNKVLAFLQKNGFSYSTHLHDKYWITIKPNK